MTRALAAHAATSIDDLAALARAGVLVTPDRATRARRLGAALRGARRMP
jgi:hypothetical protein